MSTEALKRGRDSFAPLPSQPPPLKRQRTDEIYSAQKQTEEERTIEAASRTRKSNWDVPSKDYSSASNERESSTREKRSSRSDEPSSGYKGAGLHSASKPRERHTSTREREYFSREARPSRRDVSPHSSERSSRVSSAASRSLSPHSPYRNAPVSRTYLGNHPSAQPTATAARPEDASSPSSENDFPGAFETRADQFLKEKNFSEAIKLYKLALELRPNNTFVQKKLFGALVLHGDAKMKESAFGEALKLYNEALKIQSNEVVRQKALKADVQQRKAEMDTSS